MGDASVIIVGGGFSGTITAVHLLRRLPPGARVTIVNRSGLMARGVAYGTRSERHVLNVAAGQMSAFESDPDSFVRFSRTRGTKVDGSAFVSRHLYGAYLESLLHEAAARADRVTLERCEAQVSRIEPARDGTHAVVSLCDQAPIRADRVVLAVGNYPPLPLAIDDGGWTTGHRYIADPWARGALDRIEAGDAPILLIGSGLTMIDVALELHTRMGRRCLAISRRGLLPRPHATATPISPTSTRSELPPELLESGSAGRATVRTYLRAVRRQIRDAAGRHVDWRVVIAALRPVTPRLWQALSLEERRRFLRHVKPFWEVHRHRVAPAPSDAFARLQRTGVVSVLAARLLSLREREGDVLVRYRPRGAVAPSTVTVAAVVNCIGPASDTHRLQDVLFDDLRARGVIRPDALGLGIETDDHGAVLDANGAVSSTLYYIGPFLRARDWEATAVPELRRHAERLADELATTLTATPAR